MIKDDRGKYIFISYKSEERHMAELFKSALKSRGVDVWIAPESIPIGSNYADEINNAISGSVAVLLILSKQSQASTWVPKEVSTALSYNIPVFPVHIDGSELTPSFKFFLTNVQISEYHLDPQTCLNEVVTALETVANSGGRSKRKRFGKCDRYGGYTDECDDCSPDAYFRSDDSFEKFDIRNSEPPVKSAFSNERSDAVRPESAACAPQPVRKRFNMPADVDIPSKSDARIRMSVVGVGGAATKLLGELAGNTTGLKVIAVDTDKQSLKSVMADKKVQIGKVCCCDMGTNGYPRDGERAVDESSAELEAAMCDADIVAIVSCLGGGTSSGAAPEIARLAKRMGKLVTAIVTVPDKMEGQIRGMFAEDGLKKLRPHVDSFETLHYDAPKFYGENNGSVSVADMFAGINATLRRSIKMLFALTRYADKWSDVKSVLCGGEMMIGAGRARGENREINALRDAVSNPYCDSEITVENARGAIVHVSGGGITTNEINTAFCLIRDVCARGANVVLITDIDDADDEFRAIVLASGIVRASA